MSVRIDAQAYDFPCTGSLTAANTALVIIDMQVDFCGEGGLSTVAAMDIEMMQEPIRPITAVLDAARRFGMAVIYTREGHRGDGADLSAVKRFRSRFGGAGIGDRSPIGRILIRGEPGHAIIPQLAPLEADPVIDKVGSGCFYGTEMEHLLRNRGICNLIFTGVTTECCVHTSLREASDRGFDNLLLADCTSGTTRALKEAALAMVREPLTLFGTVSTSEAFIRAIE